MKIIGIVPARMEATRFPGKPLAPIAGRPLIEHVYERAAMYDGWDGLMVATCDESIEAYCKVKHYPCVMTSDKHTRALDRVAEAAEKRVLDIDDDDIVINVQGDEPMLTPDMIDRMVRAFGDNPTVDSVMLSMPIMDADLYYNPDILKIVNNLDNRVLYTSRSPIPYCDVYIPGYAKRIYGIFGFRWHALKTFTNMPESPLEVKEACDSNRLYDNGLHQYLVDLPYIDSFSVDSPADAILVEQHLRQDPLWGKY